MQELAFLNKGVKIILDNTEKTSKEFINKYDGGVLEFVRHINKKNQFLLIKMKKKYSKADIYKRRKRQCINRMFLRMERWLLRGSISFYK